MSNVRSAQAVFFPVKKGVFSARFLYFCSDFQEPNNANPGIRPNATTHNPEKSSKEHSKNSTAPLPPTLI